MQWEAGRTEAVFWSALLALMAVNDSSAPRACELTLHFPLVICESETSQLFKLAGSWACQTEQFLSD